MFDITFENQTHFQWSYEFIFTSYEDANNFLIKQGFTRVSNGFERKNYNFSVFLKAYITPKKVYKA